LNVAAVWSVGSVQVNVWQTAPDGNFATFPENHESAGLGHLEHRDNFGIALAGGGLRGMAFAHGLTRSLRTHGVLDRAKYYSVTSGSVWMGIPLYFQTKDSLDKLLGETMPPEELTPETLTGENAGSLINRLLPIIPRYPRNIGRRNSSDLAPQPLKEIEAALHASRHELGPRQMALLKRLLSMSKAIFHCYIDPCACAAKVVPEYSMHEVWMAVSGLLLVPFGLSKPFSHYCHESIASSTRERLGPLARVYPSQDITHKLPFLVSQSAIVAYHSGTDQKTNPLVTFPIERTPLYSGIPVAYATVEPEAWGGLGGIFVEPFAFSSQPLSPVPNASSSSAGAPMDVQVTLHHHTVGAITEWQAISTAVGAAWQIRPKLDDLGVRLPCTADFAEQVNPHEQIWSPMSVDPETKIPLANELPVGDAGIYDDLGHLPLLRRGVSKMLIVDSSAQINGSVNLEANVYIKAAFGAAGGLSPPNPAGSPNPMMGEQYLTVFEPSEFPALWDDILAQHDQGESAVVRGTYTVVDNPHFGIKGGWKAEVVWVVMLPSDSFRAKLPAETERELPAYFPNVGATEPFSKFELSVLSQYASWVAEERVMKELHSMLGLGRGVFV